MNYAMHNKYKDILMINKNAAFLFIINILALIKKKTWCSEI